MGVHALLDGGALGGVDVGAQAGDAVVVFAQPEVAAGKLGTHGGQIDGDAAGTLIDGDVVGRECRHVDVRAQIGIIGVGGHAVAHLYF